MEGFPGLEEQDKTNVDNRLQLLAAAVDFSTHGQERKAIGIRRCRHVVPTFVTGLSPADYFGRAMVSNLLPPNVKVGIVIVAVGGCKIQKIVLKKTRIRLLPPPRRIG